MKNIFQAKTHCYCAFCRRPRYVYKRKSVGPAHIFAALLISVSLMGLFWRGFDGRVFAIFFTFLLFEEIFLQIRWRISIVCKSCGFDPSLYIKSPQLAAERVKGRLEERKKDPRYLLADPLNIPKIPKSKAEALSKADSGQKGSLVSKQV